MPQKSDSINNQEWNVVTGCQETSKACLTCNGHKYTKEQQWRKRKMYENGFLPTVHHNQIGVPRGWTAPREVEICPHSDLCQPMVDSSIIGKVIYVVKETPMHRYRLCTKHPKRLKDETEKILLPDNLWVATSIEGPEYLDRLKLIKEIQAKIRYVEFEPLSAPIGEVDLTKIDWVVVGGGVDPSYTEMKYEWVKDIQRQCNEQNVPFYFRRWGSNTKNNPDWADPTRKSTHPLYTPGGCLLDGKVVRELPDAPPPVLPKKPKVHRLL